MICPNCQTTLLMTDRQGVEIDYCPSCRGIWLDKGELDKILERSTAEINQAPPPAFPPTTKPPQYPSKYDGGYSPSKYAGYPPKKKKSFLSDLLDFD